MREAYKVADALKNHTSGFTWDDKMGLNIDSKTEDAFKKLVKVHEKITNKKHLLIYLQANGKVKSYKH